MNREKFIWGVILLLTGVVLLLDNLNVFDFYWGAVFRMWPLIIVVIGVNLLLPKRGAGKVVSLLASVVAVLFLVSVGIRTPAGSFWGFEGRDWSPRWLDRLDDRTAERRSQRGEIREGNSSSRVSFTNTFTRDFDPVITKADLRISGGAVTYEIEEATDDYLFWALNESTIGSHIFEYKSLSDTSAQLDFKMENSKESSWNLGSSKNEAKIRLHKDPVWNIALSMGAGSAEFDLRPYKVSGLDMQCGASSIETKLGRPYGHSTLAFNGGAASVEIEIPADVACKIVVSSALTSKDFPGFDKQSDGSYTTPGYHDTGDRYTIRLSGGLSSFSVKRGDH